MSPDLENAKIPIAEQFYSIQGEGPSAGTPAVFLRTAGCNLLCGDPEQGLDPDVEQEDLERSDDATWLCDTISVWRKADQKLTPEEIVNDWDSRGWLKKFEDGAHLILTGGEPMLESRQQELASLLDYIIQERNIGEYPYVEVETNGTVEPIEDFDKHVDQYNVSVKLSNSGMDESRRINPEAIGYMITLNNDEIRQSARFKFVASREEDVKEIRDLQEQFGIPDDMIMLMPAGYSQEDLGLSYPDVAEYCMDNGWKFSPRLHVEIWGQATGV